MYEENEKPNVTVNSILQVEVPSFEEKIINNKNETIYLILFKNLYNKSRWKLEKTYQDFITLNDSLIRLIPKVPSFGKNKTVFKSAKEYNLLIKRKAEIFDFLSECVSRKDIISNRSFIKFIELENNFPELIYNCPDFVEKIKNKTMTITEIQYLEEANIIFKIVYSVLYTVYDSIKL